MAEDTLPTYVDEAEEHLDSLNQILLDLEESEFGDADKVEEFLGELHSLKGSSKMVGLEDFGRVVHSTESLVKKIDSGEEELTTAVVDMIFEVIDELESALDQIVEEQELFDPSFLSVLLDKLALFVEIPAEPESAKISDGAEPAPSGGIEITEEELKEMDYRELQTVAKDLNIKANQSQEELVEEILAHTADKEETVVTEESVEAKELSYDPWDPQEYGELVQDYLDESQELLSGLTNDLIELEKETDPETIDSIFRAAHTLKGSSGMLELTPLERLAHTMEELLDEVRQGEREVTPDMIDLLLLANDKIEEILAIVENLEVVQIPVEHVCQGLENFRAGEEVDVENIRAMEQELQAESEEETEEEEESSSESTSKKSGGDRKVRASIRVDIQKLDRVINQVGELVINKGSLDQKINELKSLESEINSLSSGVEKRSGVGSSGDGEVELVRRAFDELTDEMDQASRDISRLISELQESVMRTRMVPIAQLFNKYPRLVRDLCREKDRDVDLVIEGKETELDKTVIEEIGDPLMHIIRNAVDHGIEPPAERKKKGKPPTGELKISAGHEGDLIVIEISDDGGGIDPEGVKESAIEKGVITPDEAEEMSDEEIRKLIFKPGFSTAEEVTETSGRGVGMDVVLDNIRNLNGSIELDSAVDEGSTFTIKLPLTLAIIQVLLVQVGEQNYALPLSSVRETLKIEEAEISRIGQKEVFDLRGQTISLLRLHQVLGFDSRAGWAQNSYPVVVVQSGDRKIGILVDELREKKEIVIKDLGSILDNVKFASGATIMGDGSVIIIVDTAEIAQQIEDLETYQPRKATSKTSSSSAPDEELVEEEAEQPNRGKVLVVEDNKTTRTMLKNALQGEGFDIEEAEDGSEGFRRCQEQDFDFISSDIKMPKMDGFEFVRKVRDLADYQYTPIIMVSTLDEKIDKMRGFDAGADDYLEKPFSEEEFRQKVNELI